MKALSPRPGTRDALVDFFDVSDWCQVRLQNELLHGLCLWNNVDRRALDRLSQTG